MSVTPPEQPLNGIEVPWWYTREELAARWHVSAKTVIMVMARKGRRLLRHIEHSTVASRDHTGGLASCSFRADFETLCSNG